MNTMTKEWLQSQISAIKAVGITESNTLQAFEIALASLEAERGMIRRFDLDMSDCDSCGQDCGADMVEDLDGEYVLWDEVLPYLYRYDEYTAPAAPISVPDAYIRDERGRMMLNGKPEPRIGYGGGWNAFRDAILQGADGNSQVMNDYPETLPCPVQLEPGLKLGKGVPTKILLEALQSRANYSAEIEVIKEVCGDIKDGDFLAAAKINGSSELVTTAYKLPKPIKDHRLNSGPDADDYYAGYQAGWNDSIGESEEVDRTAYDIESFGIFSVTHGEDDLMLQIEQFRFGTGKCPQIGKENMVPKFALQAIINRLQEHCDSMGNEALIDTLSIPVGAVQGHKE